MVQPPESAKGEGNKNGRGGGGAKPHEETPHGKQCPTPLTLVHFAPSLFSISLIKSLRNPQNVPQVTSSETVFGGPPKMVSEGPSSRGFAFQYVLPPPPPPLALPSARARTRKADILQKKGFVSDDADSVKTSSSTD